MPLEYDEDAPWSDCNKCGTAGDVNPSTGVCEYCGCCEPEAEYPNEVWVVGSNPFASKEPSSAV